MTSPLPRTPARLLALALGLGGCSHVPLSSLPALARIDSRTTQFAGLGAAVKVPSALRLRRVEMRVVARVGADHREEARIVLREVADGAEIASLASETEGGRVRIQAYRLDPADAERLSELRARSFTRGAELRQSGSLAIDLKPEACRDGELPEGPVPFTSFLRTSETGAAYVPLARNVDLRAVKAGEDTAAALPPC